MYGDAVALTGVTMEIPTASSLAVIGPNGSGKSTLLRALAGLLLLRSGDAAYRNVALASDRETFSQFIAYAGHRDAVKPALRE